MTLGDVGRGALRISPFLGAAGAVLLMVVFPPRGEQVRTTAAGPGHRYTVPTPSGLTDGEPGDTTPTTAPAVSVDVPAPVTGSATVLDLPPSSPGPGTGSPGTLTAASTLAASGSDAAPAPDFSGGSAAATPGPLTIASEGWATREAGTPADRQGVPDGTLPVGNRLGQLDKGSYVRLRGTETTLHLLEDVDGARNLAGPGVVQACRVTATWTAADAMSFDQAPAYDANACVAGTAAADNSWTFDLSSFGEPAQGNGFALVPAPSAPVDFQVTFKTG